ncbi:MAG: thiol-disulfide oxidoreductase DCC family protein [Acidimicrobiales bacterium]
MTRRRESRSAAIGVPKTPVIPATPSRAVLVYDGNCGFCTSAARVAARGWGGTAQSVPWQHLEQAGLARLGIHPDDARAQVQWVGTDGAVRSGHRAVAAALAAGRGWRRVAGIVLDFDVVAPVASRGYAWVSAHRHRLPGGTPACRVPYGRSERFSGS